MANPSSSKARVKAVAPKLVEIIDSTVYGDVWERPELSRRDRSLITVAALIGMRQNDQLRSHLEKALDHGVTPAEISEVLTHLAFYAGFPASLSAALVTRPLFEQLGLIEPEQKS